MMILLFIHLFIVRLMVNKKELALFTEQTSFSEFFFYSMNEKIDGRKGYKASNWFYFIFFNEKS